MPTWPVDDAQDPRLEPFTALTTRKRGPKVVVEGEIAVARALASDHPVDAVLVTEAHRERLGDAIDEQVPAFVAGAALVREVVGFDFHRGCLAVMPRPSSPSIASLCAGWGGGPRRVLVAESLADPANLGAVVRNARAFGVDALVHGRGADPFTRRAIRAAMGLCFSLPIVESRQLPETIDELRESMGSDTRVVAAVVGPGSVDVADYRAPERAIVLVGNEGGGLSAPVRARADDALTIPLAPGVDSLNVAAATAVMLWALRPGQ
ncbi:MAG: RNA methyltransferase [Myxococcota bacterium]